MRRIVLSALALTVLAACQPANTELTDEQKAGLQERLTDLQERLAEAEEAGEERDVERLGRQIERVEKQIESGVMPERSRERGERGEGRGRGRFEAAEGIDLAIHCDASLLVVAPVRKRDDPIGLQPVPNDLDLHFDLFVPL